VLVTAAAVVLVLERIDDFSAARNPWGCARAFAIHTSLPWLAMVPASSAMAFVLRQVDASFAALLTPLVAAQRLALALDAGLIFFALYI